MGITFKELSLPLKIWIVISWIVFGYGALIFLGGFIAGLF
jgi:hypothetical protein